MKKYAEQSEAKKTKTEQLKEDLKKLNFGGLKTWGQGGARAPRAPPGSASALGAMLPFLFKRYGSSRRHKAHHENFLFYGSLASNTNYVCHFVFNRVLP